MPSRPLLVSTSSCLSMAARSMLSSSEIGSSTVPQVPRSVSRPSGGITGPHRASKRIIRHRLRHQPGQVAAIDMAVFSRRHDEAVFLLDGGEPELPLAAFRRSVALLVAVALFMENLDATIIATGAPAIGRSLHASASSIGIAVTSYLLSVAVFVPLSGWLSDRFGSRRLMLAAVVLFTGASVLCATSTSLAELVLLRALQGLGGAMMVPVGQLVVFRAASKADMYRAVAYVTWPALIAPVIAPLLGGLLVTYASWRWIFLVNVPIGAAVLVAGYWLLDRGTGPRPPALDVAGFGYTGAGLGLLIWT